MAHARNVFARISLILLLLPLSALSSSIEEIENYAMKNPDWSTNMAIIARGDDILWQGFGNGYGKEDLHFSWSIAKTANALLLGILEHEGVIHRDDNLGKLAPQLFQIWSTLGLDFLETWDPNFHSPRNITLKNLIEMCSGIAFYEDYGDHPYESDVIPMLYGKGRGAIAGVALGRPLQHAAGTHFYYSTGDTHLSQWALKQFLPTEYQDIVAKKLLHPLGITEYRVESDPRGVYLMGSYLSLRARDYLKLAKLILQDGVWQGKRLLNSDWIKMMQGPSECYQNTQVTGDQLRPYGGGLWGNLNLVQTGSLKNYPALSDSTWDMKGRGGQTILMNQDQNLVILRFGHNHSGHRFNMETWVSMITKEFHEKK
jgi:CubicO group peptidase (beta-lactamase class C family)